MAIGSLAQIGDGSVTFTDTDLTLVAASDTDPDVFDRVIGELDANLPAVFSLHAVLTPKPKTIKEQYNTDPAEFTATLSPEGQVQLRGRLANELMRDAVEGFARARFGALNVYEATRLDTDLPNGWPVRVLAALDALSKLNFGSVVVQPDLVSLRGTTGDETVR